MTLSLSLNTTVKPVLSRQNKGFNGIWYLNEGQKYCRMLPLEHSAIILTCIIISDKSVLKTNFGVLFEWPLKTGFTFTFFFEGAQAFS